MKWNFRVFILLITFFSIASFSYASQVRVISGLDAARDYQGKSNNIYIRVGSFTNKHNAKRYQSFLRANTDSAVRMTYKHRYYMVTIGPLHSAAETRKLASQIPGKQITHVKNVQPVKNTSPPLKLVMPVSVNPVVMTALPVHKDHDDNRFTDASWILSVTGGVQFPMFNSNMTVNNGSGFPAPFDQDLYKTKQHNQPILGVSAGRRWTRDNAWLPSFAVGLSYRYLFAANAGSNILQYSDPTFNNYTYSWDVSANLLLTQFKLNVYEYAKFSPFITAALGGGLVTSDSYSESPLSGITPRVSPGFGSNNSWQFVYGIGAGLDYQIARQVIISAEYQFLDLGNVTSGSGAGSWSGQSLSLGSYRTNTVMLSVGYLFAM
jgi:opacity protein-like surface antigen